nr:MFS transporter [Cognatishimia sp. F0-27]
MAAAGLPIYIHAPKVYVDTYGVSLAALGSVLFVLRLFDVIQDPLFGRIAGGLEGRRGVAVTIGGATMALGMIGLFAVAPPMEPIWWFAITLTLVFSSFSFLNIAFYSTGVAKAQTMSGEGHLRLARWREGGALIGVCLASLAPNALEAVGVPPFVGYALVFAAVVVLAIVLMQREWSLSADLPQTGFGPVLRDGLARRFLLIALINAAPVAVSSTLFLFFVEGRLEASGWEGPLLLLFFLSAALAAPVWGMLAERWGARTVLLGAMALAVVTFSGALFLGPGDVVWFALVCVGSGMAMGADLTLLPAMFSARMARVAPNAAEGFALWSFVSKVTLAFAAVVLLPLLEWQGYASGTDNPASARAALTALYAGVPLALKLVAILLLVATPIKEEDL